MKHRVVLSSSAVSDVNEIFDYILAEAGERIARDYIGRMRDFLQRLELFPHRGTVINNDSNMRSVGYERRATVIFRVENGQVTILRVFHRGRNIDLDEI
ncbi:type II toxin-antitoxin system RelE/ParE family toxin [Rhizobium sp. C4]|uniref:type II toxin-antitoxin system RelE/ParE family toxin n=1 Tax=Rhizobium sp. C4 TaxID=1349800 RepID=UPI001E2C3B99|nr:type II toxin-antitoxin system RelE/ParE family toxin [Rhizobium sp. C4]MCD2171385.1 type II toxin-antitoxin system RelE/ParE family toxin [Rhizobium sp. C4]